MVLDAGISCHVEGGITALTLGRLQLNEVVFDELENDLGMGEFLEIEGMAGQFRSHLFDGFDLDVNFSLLRVNW